METAKDLIERLNTIDECTDIEAKKGSAIHRSVLETVCAFCNEPGIGEGYILLGVERDSESLFSFYTISGISNPDKLQLDLASQCASMFNQPVRPEIEVERVQGGLVMKVLVPELPLAQKPLYFKNEGLPRGAYRRIGSSDQRCTDDDMSVFYNNADSFDSSIVKDSNLADCSEEAIELYRTLRSRLNPYAEELTYNDVDLLQSLGCLKMENDKWFLTYAGLLTFGKRASLRRMLPLVRVDYIRVPGNEWIEDPENRFITVDMRGPLIELVQRAFNAIADDLPKGFLLPEGQVQADSIGLPTKVLREAIVNAFMHRTYRENQPIQIIRYSNRIEIKNPGFSLKAEDQLGEPGSKNRNPFIAAIFHETNIAETKGSGIRTMRNLMEQAHMVPPTFESDHSANQFTARLLLHHFLNETDIEWLNRFLTFDLNDAQKIALIFVREAGAIDNSTYRQLNGCDVLKASGELRALRDADILIQKGKARATYYLPGKAFNSAGLPSLIQTETQVVIPVDVPSTNYPGLPLSDQVVPLSDLLPDQVQSLPDQFPLLSDQFQSLSDQLPPGLKNKLIHFSARSTDKELINSLLCEICSYRSFTLKQLSVLVRRNEKYLLDHYIKPLREAGRVQYTEPDMPNHPNQAYKSTLA